MAGKKNKTNNGKVIKIRVYSRNPKIKMTLPFLQGWGNLN